MLCFSTTPLLLHDNAPAHKALVAKTALGDCGFEELSHPPYSTDFAPCDFHFFFPNLKRNLRGKHFEDGNELKTSTEERL